MERINHANLWIQSVNINTNRTGSLHSNSCKRPIKRVSLVNFRRRRAFVWQTRRHSHRNGRRSSASKCRQRRHSSYSVSKVQHGRTFSIRATLALGLWRMRSLLSRCRRRRRCLPASRHRCPSGTCRVRKDGARGRQRRARATSGGGRRTWRASSRWVWSAGAAEQIAVAAPWRQRWRHLAPARSAPTPVDSRLADGGRLLNNAGHRQTTCQPQMNDTRRILFRLNQPFKSI